MNRDIRAILGENVKKIRKKNKLSQADFAKKISLQTQAVSQIENGKAYPALKTISKICSEFNLSPACLFSYAKSLEAKEENTRNSLIETINLIISEMDNDKLEIVINIMATLAEDSVKITIDK
ncbi:MAG: helix-turn-helix domain-containing protein [Candidatus Gastranaerophilales bacterium]|nr:helix-turn-helix domain-containing protein [Candidatus Gastranaerophilales bacterium]